MKRYEVGNSVWVARAGTEDVKELCPICFGKCEVMLTLGNGDTVTLPCGYCGHGYEGPRGTVTEHVYVKGAHYLPITGVTVEQTAQGDNVEYRSDCPTGGWWTLDIANMFDTKEEALQRSEAIAAELAEQQNTRTEYLKANMGKTFAWNAGYHLREAKRKEKEAARHRECAKLCKAKTDPSKITI